MVRLPSIPLLQIRPAVLQDAKLLAAELRTQDRAELQATHPGLDPASCLMRFIEVSDVSICVLYHKRPVLLAGVYRDEKLCSPALVWLLTGEVVSKIPVCFVKLVRFFLAQWQAYYGVLFNYIDSRYEGALKLVRSLGADVENDHTYYSGQLFLKCIFRRNLWEE